MKPTRPLLGQTNHNRKRKLKESQAIPYHDQIHAIQIARGASGSVLCAEPVFSEKLDPIFNLHRGLFSVKQRNPVRFIASDKTSAELVLLSRATFPKFRGCALDPLHIVFSAEQATWGRKSDLSIHLRRIMAKFPPKGEKKFGAASSGPFYGGGEIKATPEESAARRTALDGTLSKKKALLRLSLVKPEEGYCSRCEFCRDISALVAAYPELSGQKTRSRKTVRHHLYICTDPKKYRMVS